jgi:hypothetical protein
MVDITIFPCDDQENKWWILFNFSHQTDFGSFIKHDTTVTRRTIG